MNGGAFPLPVKDILGKIYSKLRNPTIAKLFRFVGIAENAGYGMNKLESWEILTGTRPTIESDRTIATISFPLKSAIQRKTESREVPANGNNAKNVVDNFVDKLNDRQNRVLEAIKNNPAVSASKLSKSLGFNHRTVQRDLKHMQKLGIMDHEGPDKGGTWKLNVIEHEGKKSINL